MSSDAAAPLLVLASASPRRRWLLREAGYDFVVEPSRIEERFDQHEAPEQVARITDVE